jgi:hypothetical protein
MSDDISEYTASQDEKSSVSKEKLVISKRKKITFSIRYSIRNSFNSRGEQNMSMKKVGVIGTVLSVSRISMRYAEPRC